MACLVRFYVDIEHTGQNLAFYLKYKYRYFVAHILKLLWNIGDYRQSLLTIAKDQYFTKFINMVQNDATYCMDEAMESIQKINELRVQ